MSVFIEKESSERLSIPYKTIIDDAVKATLSFFECPYEAQVSVLLADMEQIRKMNAEFRGIDKTTDVLSFPALDFEPCADFDHTDLTGCFDPDTGELVLGDIALCVQKIKKQAAEYGHTQKRELAFLTVHSMLHLLGFDHEDDDERLLMEERQRQIMHVLNITR